MQRRNAVYSLFIVCLVLAYLILTGLLSPAAGGFVFALALAVIGVLSRGFTHRGLDGHSQSGEED